MKAKSTTIANSVITRTRRDGTHDGRRLLVFSLNFCRLIAFRGVEYCLDLTDFAHTLLGWLFAIVHRVAG